MRGQPGHLLVSFFNLRTQRYDYCTVMESFKYSEARNRNFKLSGVNVDFLSGTVTIGSDNNEVAEHLALAMSVAVLFVICEPRPTSVHPGCQLPPRKLQAVQKRGDYEVFNCEADQLFTLQVSIKC